MKLNQTNFAGAEVLSRAQLKKVMGGGGKEGVGYSVCCYNVCMFGYHTSEHSQAENDTKILACDKLCN